MFVRFTAGVKVGCRVVKSLLANGAKSAAVAASARRREASF
jgi:hypothetical protein